VKRRQRVFGSVINEVMKYFYSQQDDPMESFSTQIVPISEFCECFKDLFATSLPYLCGWQDKSQHEERERREQANPD